MTATEAKSYSKGNVNYELNLKSYTTIHNCGEFNILKNTKPVKIKFQDIPNRRGFISITKIFYHC